MRSFKRYVYFGGRDLIYLEPAFSLSLSSRLNALSTRRRARRHPTFAVPAAGLNTFYVGVVKIASDWLPSGGRAVVVAEYGMLEVRDFDFLFVWQ